MTGHDYERVVAQYLRNHGYTGVKVTKGSGDFGVDVIANKGGRKYAVQCKYYNNPVSLGAVQEVCAGMAYYRCNAAMVITNSTFTSAAKELASANNVVLLENVTSAKTGIKLPWLKIIAVLYFVFIVSPVVALVIKSLSSSFSLSGLLDGVGGIALISCPLWIPFVVKNLYLFLRQKFYVWKIQNGYALVKSPIIETKYVYSQLRNCGIPKKIIRVFSVENTMTASLIQMKCGVTYTTAAKAVKALEEKNLIEKANDSRYTWTSDARTGGRTS